MCCCHDKPGCRKPEHLKEKPEECPPEQVRKCHGDEKRHPCVADRDK